MKKFFLTLSFLNILWAQFSDPAQFTVSIDDVNQGEVAIIDVNAELDFTWRIYAVYDVPEGPSSTKFIIESDIVNESGRIIEPCLLYTSPSPRDISGSRMPSSA